MKITNHLIQNFYLSITIYLIVTVLSAFPFDFSTSTWAPDSSRIAVMLHPPFPISRDITLPGTISFLDLGDDKICCQDIIMLPFKQCILKYYVIHIWLNSYWYTEAALKKKKTAVICSISYLGVVKSSEMLKNRHHIISQWSIRLYCLIAKCLCRTGYCLFGLVTCVKSS